MNWVSARMTADDFNEMVITFRDLPVDYSGFQLEMAPQVAFPCSTSTGSRSCSACGQGLGYFAAKFDEEQLLSRRLLSFLDAAVLLNLAAKAGSHLQFSRWTRGGTIT